MRVESRVFLIFLGLMFILLMSVNSILFRLTNLFTFELIIFIFFLLFGIYLLASLHLEKEFVYRYLFIFFTLNILNIFFIYISRSFFKEIALPIAIALIGLFFSLSRIQKQEIVEEPIQQDLIVKY